MEVHKICKQLQSNLKGVSQRSLASTLGMSQATINTILSGEGRDVGKLHQIAAVLYKTFQEHIHEGRIPEPKRKSLTALANELSLHPDLRGIITAQAEFASPVGPIPFDAANYIRRPEMYELEHYVAATPFAILLNGESRSGLSTIMAALAYNLKDMTNVIMDFQEMKDEDLWEFLRDAIYNALLDSPHKLKTDALKEDIGSRRLFLFWLQSYVVPLPKKSLWQIEGLHYLTSKQLNDLSAVLLAMTTKRFRMPGYDRISFLCSVNPLAAHFQFHAIHESDFLRQKIISVDIPPFNEHQVQELAGRYGLSMRELDIEELGLPLFGGQPWLVNRFLYLISQEQVNHRTQVSKEEIIKLKEEFLDKCYLHAKEYIEILNGSRPPGVSGGERDEKIEAYLNHILSDENYVQDHNEHSVFNSLNICSLYQQEGSTEAHRKSLKKIHPFFLPILKKAIKA